MPIPTQRSCLQELDESIKFAILPPVVADQDQIVFIPQMDRTEVRDHLLKQISDQLLWSLSFNYWVHTYTHQPHQRGKQTRAGFNQTEQGRCENTFRSVDCSCLKLIYSLSTAGRMSVTVAKADGVTVFTLTTDPQSSCPPIFQILKSLCCTPECCSVSQQLKRVQNASLSVLGVSYNFICSSLLCERQPLSFCKWYFIFYEDISPLILTLTVSLVEYRIIIVMFFFAPPKTAHLCFWF